MGSSRIAGVSDSRADSLRAIPHAAGRFGLYLLVAVLLAGLLSGCTVPPEPRPTAVPAPPTLPLPAQQLGHPRLFLSEADVPELRSKATSTHQEIWGPILSFAQSQRNAEMPYYPAGGDLDGFRNAGNQLIPLAFAYVVTGDRAFFESARDRMMLFARWEEWGDQGDYGNRDLGFHQMLLGNAIAYDWLYSSLSEAERETLKANLLRRAEQSYEASTSLEYAWGNWWRKAYSQNHHWTNHSALGVAALVLYDEDDRARTWLNHATEEMARVSSMLEGVNDGSWHEGIAYQSYGLSLSLPFYHNLRRITGRDLLPHGYLKNYVYWRAYNSLSGSHTFVLPFADLESSWGDPYGPQGILRYAAREYRDGYAEQMARAIIAQEGRQGNVYNAPWLVFEFLYFDPTVEARPRSELPLDRTFPDLEGVIWRTDWGSDNLVFGLKTGAPGGRFTFERFVGQEQPFDPQSDVDIHNTGHDHGDAAGFFLYRGNSRLATEVAGDGLADTAYHNTLLVDGQGQYLSPRFEDPLAFKDTDGRLETVLLSPGFNYLVADATRRYRSLDSGGRPGPAILDEFRRRVLLDRSGYLVLVDRVRAQAAHSYDWVSHFPTGAKVEDGWIKGAPDNGQMLGVRVLSPSPFATDSGNDGLPFLRVRPPSPSPSANFVMVLYPTDTGSWEFRPRITLLENDDQVSAVRVVSSGDVRDHLVKHGRDQGMRTEEYLAEGETATVVKGSGGELRSVFLGKGSSLADQRGTRVLLQLPSQGGTVEVTYRGSGIEVHGEGLEGLRVFAPDADPAGSTLNGRPAQWSREGQQLVLLGAR